MAASDRREKPGRHRVSGVRGEAGEPASDWAPPERRPTAGAGRFLRFALPLTAFAMVAALFLYSGASFKDGPMPTLDSLALGAGIQVVNPRYNGQTADGAPFSLGAALARPDGPDPQRIELESVNGRFGMGTEREVTARADGGVYDRESNRVTLDGGVTVESDDGYRMVSERAEVDLDAMVIVTPTPVAADGPVGELTAGSMRATEADGGVVWFEGGVEMTIRQLVESRATGE